MNENLNLIEILKNCPIGTKFYSSYLGKDVFFIGIYYNCIKCEYTSQIDSLNSIIQFRKDGSLYIGGECMLLPSKDQRDWSKWHIPFVDGDIVFHDNCVSIFKDWWDETLFRNYVKVDIDGRQPMLCDLTCSFVKGIESRFATEEEKKKLFDTLKAKGYKWNDETKTLEKLIVPKFKEGDRIRKKGECICGIIKCIDIDNFYNVEYSNGTVSFVNVNYQNEYELVPNKFDPKTLRPFYKVLVADSLSKTWYAGFLSHIDEENKTYPFVVGFGHYRYCIPYNDDTKYLAGKPGEPPMFYRYWEE